MPAVRRPGAVPVDPERPESTSGRERRAFVSGALYKVAHNTPSIFFYLELVFSRH